MLAGKRIDRKKLLIKVAVAAVVLLGLAVILLRGTDPRALAERWMGLIRGAGPGVFFPAMALLPAVGCPMMAFTITASPAFSGTLGVGGVVAACLAALTTNLILCYWLARKALRPWLTRLLERLGYRVPRLDSGDLTDLIVVLRITPGIPFFAQNYLLGLAEAPFLRYVAISCAFQWTFNASLVIFGEALLHGKARLGIAAVGGLIAIGTVLHFFRRHYQGRKEPA